MDFFNDLASDEACKFEKEEDRTEIGIRICPTEAGKVAKCAQIDGVVTTSIGGIFNIGEWANELGIAELLINLILFGRVET